MKEIKNCPFCGGVAEIRQISEEFTKHPTMIMNEYKVGCPKCDTWTRIYQSQIYQDMHGNIVVEDDGASDAIDAWNTRVECECNNREKED